MIHDALDWLTARSSITRFSWWLDIALAFAIGAVLERIFQ